MRYADRCRSPLVLALGILLGCFACFVVMVAVALATGRTRW